MLSNTSFDWNSILESNEWNNIAANDLNELLKSNSVASQAAINQFYSKNPDLFVKLFNEISFSYSTIINALESTNISFFKSLVNDPKFKSFVMSHLSDKDALLRLLTIIMVDQSLLNQVIEWLGKDQFNQLVKNNPNTQLTDLLTCYFLAENTVGINSWSNPSNKATDEDVETMYLTISDRLQSNYNLIDLKSLMFLSSMGAVKELMSNNFKQFDLLFKSLVSCKKYNDLNVLFKIVSNLILIPKPRSDQDIKMIQMKLMSLGVDQDVAFDPNVIQHDEAHEVIVNRILQLNTKYDIVSYFIAIYDLFIHKSDKTSMIYHHFVESITHLTTPVPSRRKLVANGLLKLLMTLKQQSTTIDNSSVLLLYNIARLLTNTNPIGIASNMDELSKFIPMMFDLTHPANEYDHQLQGIMALTNLCCTGDAIILDKIHKTPSIKFTTWLKSFMTHDVIELRRVGMELFTNMIQCESFQALYMNESTCPFDDVKLVWLFAFEEDDKYLQYAALGALAYLTFVEHIKTFILQQRPKIKDELMEMLDFNYEMDQSILAVVAIMGNLVEEMGDALKMDLVRHVQTTEYNGNAQEAALQVEEMLSN